MLARASTSASSVMLTTAAPSAGDRSAVLMALSLTLPALVPELA